LTFPRVVPVLVGSASGCSFGLPRVHIPALPMFMCRLHRANFARCIDKWNRGASSGASAVAFSGFVICCWIRATNFPHPTKVKRQLSNSCECPTLHRSFYTSVDTPGRIMAPESASHSRKRASPRQEVNCLFSKPRHRTDVSRLTRPRKCRQPKESGLHS
jgi:hypothetical protein